LCGNLATASEDFFNIAGHPAAFAGANVGAVDGSKVKDQGKTSFRAADARPTALVSSNAIEERFLRAFSWGCGTPLRRTSDIVLAP
jgi:hypothetical protein